MKQRADGRWQKKITLPNGKTKFLYSSSTSERFAIKDFNEQLLKIKNETGSSALFRNIAEKWCSEYRERISDINYRKSTKPSYEKIVSYFENYKISEITPTDIHKYINKIISSKYSHKTVATHKSILNMIFNFALLEGCINSNPVQVITLPQNLPKKRREMPTDQELEIVNSNYEGFGLLPYFLLNTGLRKSEALALDYSDIDFENKTIRINKHLIHDGNKPILENRVKTENGRRTVLLLDRLAEKLPKHKKGAVFCNEDGSYLTKCQFAKRWARWQKNCGVNVTAHQLRHGFATMLFEAGIDLKDAQELMGHSDIKTTQTIYTHIRDKRKEETAKKLNDFSF